MLVVVRVRPLAGVRFRDCHIEFTGDTLKMPISDDLMGGSTLEVSQDIGRVGRAGVVNGLSGTLKCFWFLGGPSNYSIFSNLFWKRCDGTYFWQGLKSPTGLVFLVVWLPVFDKASDSSVKPLSQNRGYKGEHVCRNNNLHGFAWGDDIPFEKLRSIMI